MVRLRSAYWCNVKALMLFLVVYGHWIEPSVGSDACIEWQYRWIYLVHMPMFAFLSGLFINSPEDCIRQVKRLLPLYGILQGAMALLGGGDVGLLTPWWYLWYLLSMCMWCGAGYMWFRSGGRGRAALLAIALGVSLLAGCVPGIGRTLSLSRTAAFFPFFAAGLVLSPKIDLRKYRLQAAAGGVFAAVVTVLTAKSVPVTFLYHAEPYAEPLSGVLMRLLCSMASAILCFFVLAFTPDIRFPWTRFGADTLPVYLVHGPAVGMLRNFDLPWPLRAAGAMAFVMAADVFFRWRRGMYGVTAGERRGSCGRFSGGVRTVCPGRIPVSHGPDPG